MAFGSKPEAANGLGAPSDTERTFLGAGDGDLRTGGVGIMLSSPTKFLKFVWIVGRGGSVGFIPDLVWDEQNDLTDRHACNLVHPRPWLTS